MLTNFRQGIIAAQLNNNFVQLFNGKVTINVDVTRLDLTFAYGQHNYLFSETEQVVGAWGPFPANKNSYLYWDIDVISGLRTFGITLLQPLYGASLPTSPAVDQHYFDYNTNTMRVWNGVSWVDKIRLFAAEIQNGSILIPNTTGSQVSLNAQTNVGYILYNSNNLPLRVVDAAGKFYFVTTEDQIHTEYDKNNSYKIDALLLDGKALEPIPAYYCLTWKGPKQLGLASYVDQTPCIGISVESSSKDEVKKFVTKGFVTNFNNWNFSETPNTPLFVGPSGQITTTVPQNYSLQKIGHIVSPNEIFVDIQEIVLIDTTMSIISPTPSVSTTISVSPTPTAVLVTPSATPSVSVTPSATPSVSVTPSATPVTPSATPSLYL
jgi:hypothetical protein